MDLDSSSTTILETEIKLEGTKPMHHSQPTMELYNSTHEVIGINLPEKFHSTLVVDGRSIDIRINSLTGMMQITTRMALLEPRQEKFGRILEPIHVLLLVRDEIQGRVDIISSHDLIHPIIWYSDNPTAKNPAVLSPMNSDSHERKTNLALTQCDSPQRTIQSVHYPTSSR